MTLSSIPFTPIFSGVTWGVLTTLNTSLPLAQVGNTNRNKDKFEFIGKIASATFLCYGTTAVRVGMIPRTICAVALVSGIFSSQYLKEQGSERGIHNQGNNIVAQHNNILLGLNCASIALEVARGQVAYPLTKLAVLINMHCLSRWSKKHPRDFRHGYPRLFQANVAHLAVLASIQPSRAIWSGVCRTFSGIAHLHSLNPRIFRAVAFASVLGGVAISMLARRKNDE